MAQNQPNFLVIMADQLVASLTGAYEHPVVQTPNLNALVEQGVRFDGAYSSCPLCAPARASMFTGRHVSNCKVWDNAAPLSSDVPTLAHYLTLAGYDVTVSGKMHFIGPDQLHGIRKRLTTDPYPAAMAWLPTDKRKPEERFIQRKQHARSYSADGTHVKTWGMYLQHDDEVEFRATEYIRQLGMKKEAGEDQPFYMMASFHCPHDPHTVTQELWDLYEGAEIDVPDFPEDMEDTYCAMDRWLNAYHGTDRIDIMGADSIRTFRRAYYGLVTSIDRRVGRLRKALAEAGLAENTIIVFCADHGDMLAEKNMVQKRSFYDFSCRVPYIMHFPDGSYAGSLRQQCVSLMDFTPTLLDLAGVDLADCMPFDGESMLPVLDGGHEDRVCYAESHTNGVYATCFMARQGKWKYNYINGERDQLFDMEADPGEWHNLVDDPDYAEVAAQLKGKILARFDPDAIEADVQNSLSMRAIVKPATEIVGHKWDLTPLFDGTKMYAR